MQSFFESLESRQFLSASVMTTDDPIVATGAKTAVHTSAAKPVAKTPLAAIGLGTKLTFKKTQGKIVFGTGFESGTYKDDKGNTGAYYFPIINKINNGLVSLQNKNRSVSPGGLVRFYFTTGKPGLGGKTLTFGGAKAGSKGYCVVSGKTIYFK